MAKKVTAALENSVAPAKDDLNDYETQSHLRTLIEAHGIMNDAAKMKKVHKLAGRHHKAVSGIRSIAQLKEKRNELALNKSNPMSAMVDTDASDGE